MLPLYSLGIFVNVSLYNIWRYSGFVSKKCFFSTNLNPWEYSSFFHNIILQIFPFPPATIYPFLSTRDQAACIDLWHYIKMCLSKPTNSEVRSFQQI